MVRTNCRLHGGHQFGDLKPLLDSCAVNLLGSGPASIGWYYSNLSHISHHLIPLGRLLIYVPHECVHRWMWITLGCTTDTRWYSHILMTCGKNNGDKIVVLVQVAARCKFTIGFTIEWRALVSSVLSGTLAPRPPGRKPRHVRVKWGAENGEAPINCMSYNDQWALPVVLGFQRCTSRLGWDSCLAFCPSFPSGLLFCTNVWDSKGFAVKFVGCG